MKKEVQILICLLLATVMMSCATQQQREERAAYVQEAVAKRHWRIDVASMSTMRYGSRTVTPDFFLELRGDTLRSYLPYLGDSHRAPMSSPPQGLNFEAPILSYRMNDKKAKGSEMVIDVKTREDSYCYRIELFDTGHAYIHVQSQHSDPISFDGCIEEQ